MSHYSKYSFLHDHGDYWFLSYPEGTCRFDLKHGVFYPHERVSEMPECLRVLLALAEQAGVLPLDAEITSRIQSTVGFYLDMASGGLNAYGEKAFCGYAQISDLNMECKQRAADADKQGSSKKTVQRAQQDESHSIETGSSHPDQNPTVPANSTLNLTDPGDQQIIQGKHFRITPLGAEIESGITEVEIQACEQFCRQAEQSANYVIGDLLLFAGKRYGETYEAASKTFGLEVNTLKQIKRVCVRVKKCVRPHNLKFSVVAAIANRPGYSSKSDNPASQAKLSKWEEETRKLFARAEKENLSVREIKELLKRSAGSPGKNTTSATGKLIKSLQKLDVSLLPQPEIEQLQTTCKQLLERLGESVLRGGSDGGGIE
jgi:hypothetical protein